MPPDSTNRCKSDKAEPLTFLILVLFFLLSPLAAQARPIGTLTPFYRATQLQGHLFGMGLMEVPPYLLSPDLAFPYHPKPGASREIPFVDSFAINRMMGGYREDWLRKFNLIDPALGRRSLDYAIRQPDGSLKFRPELIRQRLQPYLDAGYTPADMTLALDNTPWDLATPDGTEPALGAWGRKTPPGDLREWSTVVQHFASDLKDFLGPAAANLTFETGVEFDERGSFDGSADAFFAYYKATGQALRSVLPGVRFGPGEFTAMGECAPDAPNCVYDTRDLVEFARRNHLGPDAVPRSLHSLVDRGDPSPAAAVARSVDSFARLPQVPAEIHQFGLLFQPFGEADGGDVGPMQADWEAQTLFGLMAAGAPRRVFHWGGFVSFGKTPLLNGSGVLRLVLDHYVGSSVNLLPTTDADAERPYPAETMAVAVTGGAAPAIIVSSFSARPTDGLRRVTIDLPPGMLATGSLRIVRYRGGEDVFSAIRRDLAADNNLKPDFDACPICATAPNGMAVDAARAHAMFNRNLPTYQKLIATELTWHPSDTDVRVIDNRLIASMAANELLVVESKE